MRSFQRLKRNLNTLDREAALLEAADEDGDERTARIDDRQNTAWAKRRASNERTNQLCSLSFI